MSTNSSPVGFTSRRVAVVTGGAGGMGAAIAREFASRRCAVAVLDLDQSAAIDVARTLVSDGSQAAGLRVDVTDADTVPAALDRVVDEFGPPTILVNSASIIRDTWSSGCARMTGTTSSPSTSREPPSCPSSVRPTWSRPAGGGS